MAERDPSSCDTFVVLPPLTAHGGVIFGKNSDRPCDEVQELVYCDGGTFPSGSKLQCTYIEIEQANQTFPVILSKPAWMWGAEMGANVHGVCIGNEAVWTVLNSEEDRQEKLLGMDLVRLGLERSQTAEEALKVISELLEKYGQGGPCSETDSNFTYHNSFLIVDPKEAWVLETAGTLWAAEKINGGYRNISNALSIETKIDLKSAMLLDEAKSRGLWNGEGDFNFANIFGKKNKCADFPKKTGHDKLLNLSKDKTLSISDMIGILRAKISDDCAENGHQLVPTSSQVSVLPAIDSGKPSCHWFTATPDPNTSVFKPFVFTPNVQISPLTVSPIVEPDPAKVKPRFEASVDRAHPLYKYHKQGTSKDNPNREQIIAKLRSMEEGCIAEVQSFLDNFECGQPLTEMDELLKDIVETEVKFYK